MSSVNISRAGTSTEPVVTMTVNARHAALLREMTEKSAVPGSKARDLADLYEMAGEAVDYFAGRHPVEPLPADHDEDEGK